MDEPIMQYFRRVEHLTPPLRQLVEPFAKLAQAIVDELPRNPERTVALRKLLEAKEAAVRASTFQGSNTNAHQTR